MFNKPDFLILIFHFLFFKNIHDIDSGHVQRGIVIPVRFVYNFQHLF